ncbi:response regulator transcription factor [Microvirga sp. STS02]|uniref:LytR/AlgR family response regulator transcription factor n=1 Tax=Hymenobacter negativus TaxID=2795026 RepID=UPI0018DD02C8|nr:MULTISPECIES: LytTR family DNA-binding domain-containing protein [Bacteria]MBH8570923.1 response regulator transcription factor [Hymenobacter negativus]MBR7210661.1 response regulator transcription factor [Microvirga sp. STS02]
MAVAPLSCVIIDDEPLAQDLLRKYVGRLPFLAAPTVFDSAVEALGRLDQLRPDLVLLDVNMPQLSGIDFLKTFTRHQPAVVLTTAYAEYAVQGFDYDAVDFLLKPISFERFVKAITKVQARLVGPAPGTAEEPGTPRVLLLKENKKFIRVPAADILFVEGMRDYLKVYTKARVILTHMTMTKMESLLDETAFLRVNRSYLVHKAAIAAIHGNTLELVNNMEVPIGINYREAVRLLTDKGVL